MIFKYIIISVLPLCFSCNTKQINIVGKYKTDPINIIYRAEKHFIENIAYSKGSNIEIKDDSTYQLEFCGNTISGSWQVKGANLILNCSSNKAKRDLRNLPCGTIPLFFEIMKNGKLRLIEDSNKPIPGFSRSPKIITQLVKE